MPSLDSFSSGIAKVPFNQAVKIAFANSQAVRRGECYKNEEQYRVMFFLNDLERPVMLADVAGLFTSNGSYAQALQHVIEEAERAANKRKLSIPDGEPASKRLTLEQEQKTEREVLMDEVSASLTTEEDKALRAQAFEVMQKESERRLALKDYKGNWSFDRFAHAVQQIESMLRSSKSKASEKDPSSLVVLTATLAVVRRVLDLPDVGNAALLEFKYLLCIAGDSDIAHLVHEFLHAKAADILARAYTMRELDFQTLQDLPLITRQTGANGVYLHYGLPKAIDGPNSLPPNERLIYVGSGTAQAKKDTWKTGQAARVYGGHLMQSRRLKEKTSKHWVSFWGTRAAVGAEPLILQKSSLDSSFEPDSASTFRSLASFGDDVPEAVVILTEAIFAVGLRAFRNPSREMAKALGILEDDAVSWRGTNVQFPTADNTTFRGTSEEQAAKGRIGAPAAAKAKRDKRIADLLAGELEVLFIHGANSSYIKWFQYKGILNKIMLSKRAWATAGLPEVPEGGLAGHAKLEIDRTANTFVYSFTTGQNEKLALFQIRHNTAATSLLPITAAGLKHLLALANIILDGGETDA